MKLKLTRRRFLAAAFVGAPAAALADAACLEPSWVHIRRISLCNGSPQHRLLHFTDLHHKGDRAYLASVVRKINALSPDAVCFTGDLIEETEHLDETLELLSGIKPPL
jgi:predicted MPP superfamily phosphohydrolase